VDLFVTKYPIPVQPGEVDVVRVDSETGAQTSVTSALVTPGGIAREASGQLLVADSFYLPQGAVIRVNPVTGAGSVVSQGGFINFGNSGTFLLDLEVSPSREIYVVERDSFLSVDQLIRIDPVSGAQALVPLNSSLGVLGAGIGVEADGSLLVTYAGPSFSLVRTDPDAANQQVVSQWIRGEGEFITDVEVEPSGTILFCASQLEEGPPLVIDSSLVRVDPATGNQTVLSTGGLLNSCVGIAVDASGAIWVSAGVDDEVSGNEAIVQVDPVTGVQTLVTSGGVVGTPFFLVAGPVGPVACADGADNDGDGFVDAADPGCLSPVDGSELSAIQCDDGIDNDGDGFTDFDPDPGQGDPQCVGPNDNREKRNQTCGLGFELVPALLALAWASRRRPRSGEPTLRMRRGVRPTSRGER
jgi:sugar lactone lactonase YvrE